MDLTGATLKPTEGRVVVKFVEGDEDDGAASSGQVGDMPMSTVGDSGCLATVIAVGPKVAGVKRGDAVVVYAWAKNGLAVAPQTVIVEAYAIAAVIAD